MLAMAVEIMFNRVKRPIGNQGDGLLSRQNIVVQNINPLIDALHHRFQLFLNTTVLPQPNHRNIRFIDAWHQI